MSVLADARTQLNMTAAAVAIGLILLLGGSLFALFSTPIPSPNHDVLLVVIGVLTGAVSTMVNFFFGSSSSQKTKDATIDTLARAASNSGNGVTTTDTLKSGDSVTVNKES